MRNQQLRRRRRTPSLRMPVVEKAAPKKPEPVLNPSAAQFKQHVEEAIAAGGLTGRAHVQGVGNYPGSKWQTATR